MGTHFHDHSLVIAASPQQCFDAITDYETFTEWQKPVISCDVLEKDKQGRGSLVETVINAHIKKIRYILRYHYDEPQRIWWDYVEGDVKSIGGEYRFEDRGDGTTEATYELEIDPGRFVPGPIKKLLAEQAMKDSLAELKKRAER